MTTGAPLRPAWSARAGGDTGGFVRGARESTGGTAFPPSRKAARQPRFRKGAGRGVVALAAFLTASCIPQSSATSPFFGQLSGHGSSGSAGSGLAQPTIVSLNPCTDAILAEVADPAQVLAISHYSHDPRSSSMSAAKARRFSATRGTVEEVLALKPTLALGSTFTDPASASAYRHLGVRLERIGMASTIEQNYAQIRQIAALAGQSARGEALIGRIQAALAAAAPPAGARPIPAVVWQSGGMVPGDDTLIADLLRRTGFSNFAAARGLGQADLLPLERMLADPPALILVAGHSAETGQASGIGGDDRVLSHPALAALGATRRVSFPANLLYCGGPTLIAAAGRLAAVRNQTLPGTAGSTSVSGNAAGTRRNGSPVTAR